MNGTTSARGQLAQNYLNVRYGKQPYTDYPRRLTEYLGVRFFLPHMSGARLLDLGAGRGEFLNGFARVGFRACGVDRSRNAGRQFPVPMVVSDLEHDTLPFVDDSYDIVFNKSVLEHVWNIQAFLEEIQRVLKPSGLLLSMVPDWTAQWRHFYDDFTHIRPFTLTGLVQLLESQGFTILEAERFRQLPFVWRHPRLHLLCNLLALLPDRFKRFKTVRFSKERMLLVLARNDSHGRS